MIQQLLVSSYAYARRAGLWSSPLGGTLFLRTYYLYKRLLERRQGELIRRLARTGSLAVDIGANVGYYTSIMAEAVGDRGVVLAFEPDADNLRLLQRAVGGAEHANVTVVPAAVGERNGTVRLYVNPDHPGDHRIYPAGTHEQSRDVEVWSLDDYLGKSGQTRELSLVKIDVQGAELQVLRGMRNTFAKYPQIQILLEFDPELLRQGGASAEDLIAFVNEFAFRPFLLEKGRGLAASTWAHIERLVKADQYVDVLLSREMPHALAH